jgi:NitT/TauT family transport system substrate-binding protein
MPTRNRNLVKSSLSIAIMSVIPLELLTLFFGIGCEVRSAPKKIVVGFLPIHVDLPLFVAQEKGFFDRRGIKVEMKRFESSPEMGTALLTGSIDVCASIATSVTLSIESRDPNRLKVFAVDAENKDNYLSSFVVLKESGITDIHGLKGKTIGSFPGPTAVIFGEIVLEKAGIDPQREVNWIELAADSHLKALEARTVDALFTYEPIATQAVIEKNAIKLVAGAVESYVLDPWQAGVWVVSTDFQVDNPELTREFILSIYDAIDFIRINPDAAKEALSQYTSIKPHIAMATPNIPFTKLDEIDLTALQKHADILWERKVISKKIDIRQMLLPTNFLSHT